MEYGFRVPWNTFINMTFMADSVPFGSICKCVNANIVAKTYKNENVFNEIFLWHCFILFVLTTFTTLFVYKNKTNDCLYPSVNAFRFWKRIPANIKTAMNGMAHTKQKYIESALRINWNCTIHNCWKCEACEFDSSANATAYVCSVHHLLQFRMLQFQHNYQIVFYKWKLKWFRSDLACT